MPTYRKLPLSVIDSLDVADMPDDFTRLTWLLLPLIVCSEGRAVDLPQWVTSKLYPARTDVDASMVAAAMDWFAQRDMIRRYSGNGRPYFYLVNFHKHQGDTGREAKSPYPPPPEQEPSELLASSSRVTHEQVATNSPSITSTSTSTNTRAEGEGTAPAAPLVPASAFKPVPEPLTRAKAKRGDPASTPEVPAAPPALTMLHRLTSYWPGDENAGYLTGRLGDEPDERALARAVELWRAAGYKKNNWIGICDFYDELCRDPGWHPGAKFKQPTGKTPTPPKPEGYVY